MYWSDEVAQKLKERNLPLEWVDDMKTPSGRIHVGALMGVVIHGLIHRSLKELDVDTRYTYVFENHDPMDDIPSYLSREEYEQYLGVPLYKIPSPIEGYENFAAYYAQEFMDTFNAIGFHPEILWTKDLYTSGKMNDGIKKVLDNADTVRKIYEELYKKEIAKDWYPFQVYCEQCGKVSTTRVYNWDGEKVHYKCPVDATDWTPGCGYEGSVSPYSDESRFAGKMPWKVEWAVKWQAIGVTVEGAGKDHMSKGGSHDLASLVAERVLSYSVPYPIAYEWMLIGGKKMSSSKGVGSAASDMLQILPPELLRFLIVKMNIYQQTNFDPTDPQIIPKLFDEYQEYAQHYFDGTKDDYARTFELSQVGEIQQPPNVRFTTLAQWVQMPNMQETIEKEGLLNWAPYAKYWLENFAPENDRFTVQENMPEAVSGLSELQKEYLRKLAQLLDDTPTAEQLQVELYDLAKGIELGGRDAFQAIYTAILGKPSGPKAAWLITSLDPQFVKRRFTEI
ncbi:MAG TPA: lysine--tRNA ligase [Candidatus Levybacteria bacterium]|nr:lysine--tRNA ligase [Candidatus Levybacteria bacterium]